jgi:Cu-Zn family superoxide dismutase
MLWSISSFTSAGGHYNPTSQTHRSHAGDMPVLLVNADGTGEARFKTDRSSVAAVIGRAVIVHADADNYANIPARYHSHTEDVLGPDSATLATGDAGARASCGVIVSSDD